MDQHKLLTLQTTLDSCTALFKTLFDSVGLKQQPSTTTTTPTTAFDENELITLNKFHLYGDTNIDQVFNSIDSQLQTIKFTCQQYRQWDSTEREAMKFLYTQRMYVQLQQRSNLISKTIFDCSLIGKIYLNQQLEQQKKQQQQQQTIEPVTTSTSTNENSNPSSPTTNSGIVTTGIPKNVEIKRKLGLLAGKLQEMTNELNQKYSTFTVLDDLLALLKNDTLDTNPESYVSCNISSSTFLLDIDIFNNGEIKEVKLAHLSLHDPNADAVPAEQQFNDELTVSLKTDIKDFAQRVVRICDLDLLFRKYKYCDLQKAFSILQSDFLNISINSKKKYNDDNGNQINNKGFGEIKLDCCGVLILYFNPLIDKLSGKHEPYSIMIEMESSAVTSSTDQESEYSRLSLKSLLNISSSQTINFDENECFDNEPLSLMLDQDFIFSPVRLVLKLNYPMVITNDQLLNILNLSKQQQQSQSQSSSQHQQQQQQQQLQQQSSSTTTTNCEFKQPNNLDQIKKYSIQNQLIGSGGSDCFDNNVFDSIQRYYYTGEYHLGVEVSRIPISHPSQVYPTIQLLRQQLTFNILFKSCFSDLNGNNNSSGKFKSTMNNTAALNSNIPIFEVTSTPPVSINLIFLHPTEMNFNSIDILIGNNGELNALYFDNTSSNQPNLSKSKLFTKLLSKSCSISVSIACFFKQKN